MSTPATEWIIMTDIGRDEDHPIGRADWLRHEVSLRDEERGLEGVDPDIAIDGPSTEESAAEEHDANVEDQDTWPEEQLGSF